jgi:coenzyme F420 hydrogenase subunit beta
MKAVETGLHLRRERPAMMKNMIPDHVWRLVKPYGIEPGETERRAPDD